MPYDPPIKPFVPAIIFGTYTVSKAPLRDGMQEVTSFNLVRTRNREVTVRCEDGDVLTSLVPCIAPWIKDAVPADEARWELLSKADVAELAFVGGGGNSDDCDCALKVFSQHTRELADPSGKVAIC